MQIATFPSQLQRVHFARLAFTLEFLDACQVQLPTIMGLRSRLLRAAKQTLVPGGPDAMRRFRDLFDPGTDHDPVAVRKYQKPSPPFVLLPEANLSHRLQPGDEFHLKVLFWDKSIPLIDDFRACLQQLGRHGLTVDGGRFDVTSVLGISEDGSHQTLWRSNCPDEIAPTLVNLNDWLERNLSPEEEMVLAFCTPTRLMSSGRPLRRPGFNELFPFVLRRVTSMLYAHADCEPLFEVEEVLEAASGVETIFRRWQWQDWKHLQSHLPLGSVGGFVGHLGLRGPALLDLGWILAIASLLGIGKGSAYGAGRFLLQAGPADGGHTCRSG